MTFNPAWIPAIASAINTVFGGTKETAINQATPTPAGGNPNPNTDSLSPPKRPPVDVQDPLDGLSALIAASLTPQRTDIPSSKEGQTKTEKAGSTPGTAPETNPWLQVLQSMPASNSPIWALLGLGPQQQGDVRPAPIAGGAGGALVSGLGLQRRKTLGELLGAIPRVG